MKIGRLFLKIMAFIMFAFSGCVTKPQHDFIITEKTKYVELSNFMQQVSNDDLFSGVVLIAKDNKIFFEGAYGLSDKSKNQYNNIDTKFNIGSAVKMFTAVAIAQLVEQGKLSFENTIDKYIDDFPREIANKITIEQLLSHTSGLGDIFTPAYITDMNEVDTIEGFMSYIIRQPLVMEPGTRFNYSNGGFVVLGAIIERVSGENYYDYIRKHITEPLGMKNTDFFRKADSIKNLAQGYINTNRAALPPPPQDGQPRQIPPPDNRNAIWENNYPTLPLIGNPSGGAYSTVRDLLKFSIALKEYTVLSKEFTDIIMTGKVNTPMGEYGYGFEVLRVGSYHTLGHSGGAPGLNALFRILTNENSTVILLSNYDEGTRIIERDIFSRFIPVKD